LLIFNNLRIAFRIEIAYHCALDFRFIKDFLTESERDEASAMQHFEAAIVANPHFPEPRFGKALLLKNQDHLDGAAEALDSLLHEATPEDARSNPVFQRAEQLLASIRQEIRERGGPTNPELLQEKHPAAVWHLLDALKRFDSLDPRRVGEITFEVAQLRGSLSR